MSPWAVALEVPALLVGPLVCRVTGRHRWHVWRHHAAPTQRICLRCGGTGKENR